MGPLLFKARISFFLCVCVHFAFSKATNSEEEESETRDYSCTGLNDKNTKLNSYHFYPASSITGIVFVAVWFVFVLIAKIMYNSTDQYKINNRFDLVIFKPATKNSLIGPRRIYSNNNVNVQNINAANASGMDLSFLYQRNASISQPIHGSLSEGALGQSGGMSSVNKISL
jgi:hypothetical protein